MPNVVNVKNNFDDLLIPQNHPSRKMSDTYYISPDTVLRTHTSAHQTELLSRGETQFIVTGDVYRKDEIDARHYNIFHQMEGVKCFSLDSQIDIEAYLKQTLSGLVQYLFPGKQYRFNNDYFPFTNPSFEVEVLYNDKWMEVLGCGVIHTNVLNNLHLPLKGWAFGLGLERLAMVLFNITDIRLFWTNDQRFYDQFTDEQNKQFIPYPQLEPIVKDISFWIPENQICTNSIDWYWLEINNFYDKIRDICGNSIESVELFDKFYHKKLNKYSMSFHLKFCPETTQLNPAEFNCVANDIQHKIWTGLPSLNIEMRSK